MKPKSSNYESGRSGEQQAEAHLIKLGYQIIDRNARMPFGEIDLVAKEGGDIVFIEVKSRRNSNFGFPEEAVGSRKRAQLMRLATSYMVRFGANPPPFRFDVLTIEQEGATAGIRLVKNALEI